MLGSFLLNGVKYHAADLFAEGADDKQVATVLISKKANLISETNPLTEIATDNGNIKSVTYATIGEGAEQKTVAWKTVKKNSFDAIRNTEAEAKKEARAKNLAAEKATNEAIAKRIAEKKAAAEAPAEAPAEEA